MKEITPLFTPFSKHSPSGLATRLADPSTALALSIRNSISELTRLTDALRKDVGGVKEDMRLLKDVRSGGMNKVEMEEIITEILDRHHKNLGSTLPTTSTTSTIPIASRAIESSPPDLERMKRIEQDVNLIKEKAEWIWNALNSEKEETVDEQEGQGLSGKSIHSLLTQLISLLGPLSSTNTDLPALLTQLQQINQQIPQLLSAQQLSTHKDQQEQESTIQGLSKAFSAEVKNLLAGFQDQIHNSCSSRSDSEKWEKLFTFLQTDKKERDALHLKQEKRWKEIETFMNDMKQEQERVKEREVEWMERFEKSVDGSQGQSGDASQGQDTKRLQDGSVDQGQNLHLPMSMTPKTSGLVDAVRESIKMDPEDEEIMQVSSDAAPASGSSSVTELRPLVKYTNLNRSSPHATTSSTHPPAKLGAPRQDAARRPVPLAVSSDAMHDSQDSSQDRMSVFERAVKHTEKNVDVKKQDKGDGRQVNEQEAKDESATGSRGVKRKEEEMIDKYEVQARPRKRYLFIESDSESDSNEE